NNLIPTPSQQLTNLIRSFNPHCMRPSSISNERLRFQLFFLKSLLEIIQNHPNTDFNAQLLGLANIIEQSEGQFYKQAYVSAGYNLIFSTHMGLAYKNIKDRSRSAMDQTAFKQRVRHWLLEEDPKLPDQEDIRNSSRLFREHCQRVNENALREIDTMTINQTNNPLGLT
ncbi:MAG: hypothetical protein CMF55_02010, partial [Legionellales bacterium]|nr:hypothetical protein [Legionellales bacterium]